MRAQRLFFDITYTRLQRDSVCITRTVRRLFEKFQARKAGAHEVIFSRNEFHQVGAIERDQRNVAFPSGWLFRLATRGFGKFLVALMTHLPWPAVRPLWEYVSGRAYSTAGDARPARFLPGDLVLLCDACWNFGEYIGQTLPALAAPAVAGSTGFAASFLSPQYAWTRLASGGGRTHLSRRKLSCKQAAASRHDRVLRPAQRRWACSTSGCAAPHIPDDMNIARFLQTAFLPPLQSACSELLSILAKARMALVSDSGTEIGARAKLFRQIIPKHGVGAELGVYKGTLSRFILSANDPRRLHLVDPWWKYEAQWHWAVGDRSSVRSLGALVIALEDDIARGRVELHIADSVTALEGLDDECLDWAYVDSTHAYEDTKAEIALLKRKVKASGIIAGDDWREDPMHPHHGVCRAVREFLAAEPAYGLIFQEDTQWAISKQSRQALPPV